MKKKTVCGVAFLLALAMLSGCAGEAMEPTSVNQGMLLEKSAQEQSVYSFPEKFTGDWTGQDGRLTIHADAQVVAELGTDLPTATLAPREFTQADVDNLLRVFLKGEPLYAYTQTKQELQTNLDYINSPDWQSDPAKPRDPASLEKRRQELNDWYQAEIAKAPAEKPIVHGFSDSENPWEVSGTATVDGKKWEVSIDNCSDLEPAYRWISAQILRSDYKYRDYEVPLPEVDRETAVAYGNALMEELGFDNMVLDDVQMGELDGKPDKGLWELYYTPTVNGIPISSIRRDRKWTDDQGNVYHTYEYENYGGSEETNPDTVSWYMECIRLDVGKEGVLSFYWAAPSTQPVVREEHTAMLPFDEIAAIADTMLPVVIIGPSEARPLVEIDRINGFETRMDVELTKVSLSLMRVRDKGSLQGIVVPVWDFWGTSDWYDPEPSEAHYTAHMVKGRNTEFGPLLTLNAIDGTVVSRLFGY